MQFFLSDEVFEAEDLTEMARLVQLGGPDLVLVDIDAGTMARLVLKYSMRSVTALCPSGSQVTIEVPPDATHAEIVAALERACS